MKNLNLLRGVVVISIALLFGILSFKYRIGDFGRAGPGLFPLMVSCLVFVIGLITIVRSFLAPPVLVDYNVRNISIILLSLCGFALLSEYVNMIAAIVFLVFFSTIAGSTYSVVRNVKISAALLIVAFIFRNLLGLQLPLY